MCVCVSVKERKSARVCEEQRKEIKDLQLFFCDVVEESSSVSVKTGTWCCCPTVARLGLKSPASATKSSGAEPPPFSAAESTELAEGLEVAPGN